MDRNDYKNLISEANALIKSGGEADALDLLDSVNWRKIKNVNALIEISNLYEQLGHIEDSKLLLTYAHERSPIGRMILYHLTLVCVKMDEIEEAEGYLEEFVQIAPHDSKKYILRYNIAKAKDVDIREQINILEEMKDSDFIEEWAFELAYLYYKAGEADKCINLCDEIVIWFGDGPYVAKALELKMLYSPLDDEQAEKYQDLSRKKKGITHFKQNEMLESGEVIRHDIDIATVEEAPDHLNTVNLQAEIKRNIEEIMEATKEGEVNDNLENIKELIEEIPYLKETETIEEAADKQKKDNKKLDDSLKNHFKELMEENDGQISMLIPEGGEKEEQVKGQMTIQDIMDNWAKTQKAAEEALESAEEIKLQQAKKNAIAEASQIMNKLEDVMPKLEAGVTTSEIMKEEVINQAEEARAKEEAELRSEEEAEAKEKPEEKEESKPSEEELKPKEVHEEDKTEPEKTKDKDDDLKAKEAALLKIKELGERRAREEAQNVEDAKAELERRLRAKEHKGDKDSQTYTVPKLSPDGTKVSAGLEIPVIEQEKGVSHTDEKPIIEASDSEKEGMSSWTPPVLSDKEIKDSKVLRDTEDEPKMEEVSKVVTEAATEVKAKEPKAEPKPIEPPRPEPTAEEVRSEEVKPEAIKPKEIKPEEVKLTEPDLEEAEITPVEEDALEEPEVELSPEVNAPEVKRMPPSWETSKTKVLPHIGPDRLGLDKWPGETDNKYKVNEDTDDDNDDVIEEDFKEEEKSLDDSQRLAGVTASHLLGKDLFAEPEQDDIFDEDDDEDDDLDTEEFFSHKEEPEEDSEDDDNMITLSPEEREIFSYFMPIEGMEKSLCKALYNTKNHLQGQRDTGGHIIVQGIQGAGKTMLATSIVKVLQSQIGLPAGNVGKVDGDKLNGKDIAKLFQKIPGGCLIIEKAGEINRETAIRLALMMDNDNTGILIILEDTRIGIERLLKLSAELSRKFTERIIIPAFTIDELVEFAKVYAEESECVIDEMGILAIYDRINIIQSLDHPTAVAEVKEIMDEAMENADKGGIKKTFGRFGFNNKKYDENGYMILRERDFQI